MKADSGILYAIATGLYSGKSPFAPGTIGTLAGVILVLLTSYFSLTVQIFFFIFLLVIGVIAAEYHERSTGISDAGEVVIDEIAAYYLVMLFFPATFFNLFWAFVLFRIFDIVKPFPIKRLEEIGGGVGVMLDDLAAGVYAIAGMYIIHLITWMATW